MVTVPDQPAIPVDWADVYAEHGQALRRIATAAMGGPEKELLGKTADDVVGDLICELMVRETNLGAAADRGAYLRAAVRNRVRDLQRRSAYERPKTTEPDDVIGEDDIEAAVDRADLASQAVLALEELPSAERRAITERVMHRRPAKDVGPKLGVAPQRVSQLVNAGLRRLRERPAFKELLPSNQQLPGPSGPKGRDETGIPT